MPRRRSLLIGVLVAALLGSRASAAQEDVPGVVKVPPTVTALEGRPLVVTRSEAGETERTVLAPEQAKEQRLLVTVVDGRFYWASRQNRPLTMTTSGAFTLLDSGVGSYVKFTSVDGRILYIEHVNVGMNTLTYWGVLEVVTGR
jgi:hypothetical protein